MPFHQQDMRLLGWGGITFPSLRRQRRYVDGGQRSVIGLDRWQMDFRKSCNDLNHLQTTSR